MRKVLFPILLFLIGLSPIQQLYASHIYGATLQTECISGCTTRIHLTQYVVCGVSIPGASVTITPLGGCAVPAAVSAWSSGTIADITPICPTANTLCTNPASNIYGLQEVRHTRDYAFCEPVGCQYEISYSECCRQGGTNVLFSYNFYIFQRYTITAACNTTPVFTAPSIVYVQQGIDYKFHVGAYDIDGDQLSYSLSPIYDSPNTPSAMSAGFSATAPLGPTWAFQLDGQTGMLSIDGSAGNLVVGSMAVMVEERRNGNLISETLHEIQLVALANPTSNLSPEIGAISALSGGNLSSPYHIQACVGSQVCFTVGATDPNSPAQNLKLYWDNHIFGAAFSDLTNGAQLDTVFGTSPQGRFCWTNTAVPGTYQFLLTATDDVCPLRTYCQQIVTIEVLSSMQNNSLITSSGTLHPCNGTGDTLDTGGGYTSYTWNNGATSPLIVVNAPGLYQVTATTSAGCSMWDSITVWQQAQVNISGTILDHLSAPLINQRVWLIRHDSTLQSLQLIDSAFTDASGQYMFCDVAEDTVYVKAAPSLAAYPNDMPTYADTAIFFAAARPVLATQFPATVNFSTRQGTNPGGIGFIGGLLTQGANKTTAPGDPVPGQMMLLYSPSLGQAVAYATTDANGYFGFYFLTPGDYKVIADKPGVDPYNVPGITLTAQQSFLDSLDFRLHTTYLELALPSLGTPSPKTGFSVAVSPNPISDAASLRISLPEQSELGFKLMDMQGRTLGDWQQGFSKGQHVLPFDSELLGMKAGTYFLQVKSAQQTQILKIHVLR